MKIGILTFHKALNSGAVLQTFALRKAVRGILPGSDVSVIDYMPKRYDAVYAFAPPHRKNPLKRAVHFLLWTPMYGIISSLKRKYLDFQSKYLSLSEKKYFFDSDFESLNSEYDALITGSDQIWNTHLKDCDPIYFLPMRHKAKKISYAPSMNRSRELEPQYVEMLRDYDSISIREQTGKQTLVSYLGDTKDIFIAADPTLLLNPVDYEAFGLSRIVRGCYIFLYTISMTDDVLRAARSLSQSCNLPVYAMVTWPDRKTLKRFADARIRYRRHNNGPIDFLSYVKNAELVVTDSFHGTAFSVIFEKPFYSINSRGASGLRNDERICMLLDRLGLRSRYVTLEELDASDPHSKIDYEAVTSRKRDYAKESAEWLKRALEQPGVERASL